MNISSFSTFEYFGYNVKFSPHFPNVVALAASQNYGITGKGSLFILQRRDDGVIQVTSQCEWPDSLYDVAWSEFDQNVVITCSGDGSIQIWNLATSSVPVRVLLNHDKEVYGIDCGSELCANLLSASWDRTIKLWDAVVGTLIGTYTGHDNIVYNAVWSPYFKQSFSSVSGDKTLRLWDVRRPQTSSGIVLAHNSDVLNCDWCKYESNLLVTCGADGLIKGWDLRKLNEAIFQLVGHEYAVRRVKFSPFHANILASVSYDFTSRIWDWNYPNPIKTYKLHTEFAYGVDFSLHIPNMLADCGWDSIVHMYETGHG